MGMQKEGYGHYPTALLCHSFLCTAMASLPIPSFENCSSMGPSHRLQCGYLLHHGPLYGLQDNACSSAWRTSFSLLGAHTADSHLLSLSCFPPFLPFLKSVFTEASPTWLTDPVISWCGSVGAKWNCLDPHCLSLQRALQPPTANILPGTATAHRCTLCGSAPCFRIWLVFGSRLTVQEALNSTPCLSVLPNLCKSRNIVNIYGVRIMTRIMMQNIPKLLFN